MNSTFTPQPNCLDGSATAISFEQAKATLAAAVQPISGHQALALRAALGRVLAQSVISPANVPPHRNSAMDGYALRAADLPEHGSKEFNVLGTAWAGRPYQGALQAGHCVRIMTGAKLPEAADCVVIQEQAQVLGETRIRLGSGHRGGQNIRHPGEDIRLGQTLLAKGQRVGAAELGLLASLGIAEVSVYRRVRAAFFTSGDELRSIGQTLAEGQIYDSNRYTLYGMLHELGVEALDLGVVPDRAEDLRQALSEAADQADLVLTTGGISVGAADHLQQLIRREGQVLFSKVAIKPGRPVTFGRWNSAWYFGLPGNPVASMTTFYQFARPVLRRLQGESEAPPRWFSARSAQALKKQPGRTEIQRGVLFRGDDGELWVRTTGRQGSGVLSSMSQGNCFILLPEQQGAVASGDALCVEPFDMLRY
jgi:molybdopterin molybdotransferase